MSEEQSPISPFYSGPRTLALPGTLAMRNLAITVLSVMGVCWVCTQFVAQRLGYQEALGEPLLALGGWKLYGPTNWLSWYAHWHKIASPVVSNAFHIAWRLWWTGIGVIVVAMSRLSKRTRDELAKQSKGIHGSAHWASRAEVAATGLLNAGRGVYVGGWKHPRSKQLHYLRHDGPEHIMAFAPTRAGKGVGLVLPTLLSWPHSTVVYDIKGENWALTAGWRKLQGGNRTLKFEPSSTDGSSARFNPLLEVRLGTDHEVADVQNIVNLVVDGDVKGQQQDHWVRSAQALLVGVILHILYAGRNKTLNGVIAFLTDPSRNSQQTMQFMLDTDHDMTGPGWPFANGAPNYCHPIVAQVARDMLNKAEEERSGVLSSLISYLTLYRDPIVARNTSTCDFRVHDLMNQDEPVSLYLVVPPSDKARLRPLIRLVITQIVRGLTEKMHFENGSSVASYKHRMLLMLDEFPSLGKLEVFEESLAFMAGYGLKAYLIIQDISQLWTAYGKDESIFSNCHVRVAYAPNKVETAELLSKMAGTATIVKRNNSHSSTLFGTKSNIQSSIHEGQRPLLTTDEVMRLPGAVKDARGNIIESGDMLIFMAGQTPIYGKQILYFRDPVFSVRARIPAPAWSDILSVVDPFFMPPPVSDFPSAMPPGVAPPVAGGVAGAMAPIVAPPVAGDVASAMAPIVAPPVAGAVAGAMAPIVAPPVAGAVAGAMAPGVAPPISDVLVTVAP
jgi:type IV secretion system protein VirD4